MAQFGVGLHPGRVNLLEPLGALVLAACTAGLAVAVLERFVPRVRRALRSRIARRRAYVRRRNAELRARAMMDELCPLGWRAQITLFRACEDPRGETRDRQRDWVALDWTAFEGREGPHGGGSALVWPATISEALDAMLADRRTDETLQHVEQDALADGAIWPDL